MLLQIKPAHHTKRDDLNRVVSFIAGLISGLRGEGDSYFSKLIIGVDDKQVIITAR